MASKNTQLRRTLRTHRRNGAVARAEARTFGNVETVTARQCPTNFLAKLFGGECPSCHHTIDTAGCTCRRSDCSCSDDGGFGR